MVSEDAPRSSIAEDGVIDTNVVPKNESAVDAPFERIINNIVEHHGKEAHTKGPDSGRLVEIYSRDEESSGRVANTGISVEIKPPIEEKALNDDLHLEQATMQKLIQKNEMVKSKFEERIPKDNITKEVSDKPAIRVPAKTSKELKNTAKFKTVRALISSRLQTSRYIKRSGEQTRYIELKISDSPKGEILQSRDASNTSHAEISKSKIGKHEVNKSTIEQTLPQTRNMLRGRDGTREVLDNKAGTIFRSSYSASSPTSVGSVLANNRYSSREQSKNIPNLSHPNLNSIKLNQIFYSNKKPILGGFISALFVLFSLIFIFN